jgi:hypothetical protein
MWIGKRVLGGLGLVLYVLSWLSIGHVEFSVPCG